MKNKKERTVMLIVLVFLLFLCFLFPYSGDDWAWGSSIGTNRLKNLFYNYNGRWAGNIIVIILTRSVVLRTFAMATCLFGIIYLTYKLTNKKRFSLFLLSTLLILALPRLMLRQAVVWTSGFTNYAIPIFLILIYLYILNKDIEIDVNYDNRAENQIKKYKNKKRKYLLNTLMMILGFITALFVEHVTIYIIVMSVIVIVYQKIKYKRMSSKSILYLVGAIFGAVLMFSNTAYITISKDNDSYRNVPTSGISSIIEKVGENYQTIYKELVYNNTFLNFVLVTLLVILIYQTFKNDKNLSPKKKHALYGSSFVAIGYVLYSFLKLIYPSWKIVLKYTNYFEFGISVLFFFTIIAIAIMCIENKKTIRNIIFYWISIGILTAPLFLVHPIGSRCFFPMYCLFIGVILELYNYCIKEEYDSVINKIMIMGSVILAVYLTSIYAYIYKVNQERIDYVLEESKNGSKTIEVVKLPYGAYVWYPEPTSDTIWEERFKLFYGIPKDVELVNVTLKEWNANN